MTNPSTSHLSPQPLSPLDGRYQGAVTQLGAHLSEAGLNRARLNVEVEWFLYLTDHSMFGSHPLSEEDTQHLRRLVDEFGDEQVAELGAIEAVTNHDVKAVEVFLRRQLDALGLTDLAELTHIACTSEDINNLSYALTVRDSVTEVWLPKATALVEQLSAMATAHKDAAMLARTHGQPATPTTLGKELAVFAHRLRRQLTRVQDAEYLGKFNGATGTYSAHLAAGPDYDWPAISEQFVTGLGLTWNPLTTQIESHDWQAELYNTIALFNRILHGFCTDIWTYISLGYFHQVPVKGEVGSSTMPHKINPIRFENAEANLEISNALLNVLAETLTVSRMQRDLTDSSSQRNIGVAFGHSVLAIDNVSRGLSRLEVSTDMLNADLAQNWEVLAEAIQTVIRAEVVAGRSQISDPYTVLKELTRGRRIGKEDLVEFVRGLDIGEAAKQRLLELTPHNYTGLAAELAT